jgi:hypothetical protein
MGGFLLGDPEAIGDFIYLMGWMRDLVIRWD